MVRVLREALALAEAGEIESAIIIMDATNGEWVQKVSASNSFCRRIGQLEIIKHEMIAAFCRDEM